MSLTYEHAVFCASCGKHVSAPEKGAFDSASEYSDDKSRFTLLQCPHCEMPILVAQDYSFGPNGWEPDQTKVLFPVSERQLGNAVPESVRRSYLEASRCFSSAVFIAAALLCRRTLEALVNELLPDDKRRGLAKGISALKEHGLIDPQLVDWADALRVTGNKAAHDVDDDIGKQDAQDLLDFTHALIEYAFTYKAKFSEFKERAKARDSKSAESNQHIA